MLVGILLVILGVLILLDKLNIITGGAFDYFWPAVIIAVGIWMIAGDKKKRIK
jgi:ABC-type phosphate transport system auxiliary subunit